MKGTLKQTMENYDVVTSTLQMYEETEWLKSRGNLSKKDNELLEAQALLLLKNARQGRLPGQPFRPLIAEQLDDDTPVKLHFLPTDLYSEKARNRKFKAGDWIEYLVLLVDGRIHTSGQVPTSSPHLWSRDFD